jgi:GRAM domain
MADISPAIVPDVPADGKASGDSSVVEIVATDAHGDSAASESHGFFGGWVIPALPDMHKVTEGIGGLFGVDGSGGEDEETDGGQSGDIAGASDAAGGDSSGGNDDIQKAAAEMAAGATKELEKASKVAQDALGHAAQDIGKGWGKLNHFLDDILAPKTERDLGGNHANAEDLAEDEDVQVRFHSLFPDLDESESVVDHYGCSLLQKYRCYLNNDTPEKSLAVRGRLFVSTSHLAMYVFDDGGAFDGAKFHVTVPLADVARVQKGAKSMMRVITSSQSSYIFAEFESETHFAGALSLVEHMIESNLGPPEETGEAAAAEHAGDGGKKTSGKMS